MSPLVIRAAVDGDYPAFARLFPELAVPDPVPPPGRFVDAIRPDSVVALDGSEVVGVAWARPRGERLHVVYLIVDPARRRRGVGRALMRAVAARARAAHLARWMLTVKPDNVAGRALYRRCGMREVAEAASMRITWDQVSRLPPPPVGVGVGPLDDDGRFERALSLSRGELASVRALPGRVLFGAELAGAPVGLVAFDPAFPGTSPLRVLEPAYARPLFEAAAPLAPAGRADFFAFVEGDPALEQALAAVGAEVALRALRMEGAVPAADDDAPGA